MSLVASLLNRIRLRLFRSFRDDTPLPQTAWKFVVFLDFDGVLHPGTTGTMRLAGALEALLEKYPDVRIVISSSWRMGETLDELRGWFSPSIASRIIGVTPVLAPSLRAVRQAEAESWLGANPTRHWCALDDEAELFQAGCSWLILTDSRTGLTQDTLRKLEAKLRAAGCAGETPL